MYEGDDQDQDAKGVKVVARRHLPVEWWALALSFLDWKERLACGTVSSLWRQAVNHPTAWQGFSLTLDNSPRGLAPSRLSTWLTQWAHHRPTAAQRLTRLEATVSDHLSVLAAFPALTSLVLDNQGMWTVTDWTKLLSTLPLRHLKLLDVAVPTMGLALSRCSLLTQLSLQFCVAVTDETLCQLGLLRELRHLSLASCEPFTGSGLAHLPHSLTHLELKACNHVTELPLSLPRLGHLRLYSLPLVTDAGFQQLASSSLLQTLVLDGLRTLTDAGLSSVLSGFSGLKVLDLSYMDGCNGSGLLALRRDTPLSLLALHSLKQLRTVVLVNVVWSCHALCVLRVSHCNSVDEKTVRARVPPTVACVFV